MPLADLRLRSLGLIAAEIRRLWHARYQSEALVVGLVSYTKIYMYVH